MLGNIRLPVQIDVGFGDAITPPAIEGEYPTLLTLPAPVLRMYPVETVVAEKLEAIVRFALANTRLKDFYDLWSVAQTQSANAARRFRRRPRRLEFGILRGCCQAAPMDRVPQEGGASWATG